MTTVANINAIAVRASSTLRNPVPFPPQAPAVANIERLFMTGWVPRNATWIADNTNGPYISHVMGERFSDVKRQPDGDQRLRVARVNAEAEPESPPAAICVNHDPR
jgi:hypothetical protein